MNNFLKEYQEFYKDLKTLPARISKQVVEDLTQLITEKHMDLYDLISEQNYSRECSSQTNTSSQMEDINNLLEQLDHIKKESERIAADNIELRKDLEVAKETNKRVYNLADKRNAQLEEANHSLNECKEKIERLDKIIELLEGKKNIEPPITFSKANPNADDSFIKEREKEIFNLLDEKR